jgi:hypothetical protein
MHCKGCETEVIPSFKFCPECGTKLEVSTSLPVKKIPERFLPVIDEYESLTHPKLTEEQKLRFIESPPVGKLSVNDPKRRSIAAKQVLSANGDGTFKLDVLEWAKAMYDFEDPQASSNVRVWMTAGGERYHKNRDCKGLIDGQNFASWKGKETYRPQFVSLKEAAWVLGKAPCDVCKPDKWNK